MIMPEGLNGSELCRRLRQDKPELKVIISSGYFTELGTGKDATGADVMCLPKPCSSNVVLGAIQACLGGNQ
jgi:CheY-like chemotaxis protein